MATIDLDICGIDSTGTEVLLNAVPSVLVERALANGEADLTDTGALRIMTGVYTGRSPKDRFIVDTPEVHDQVAWGPVNMPISQESYEIVRAKATGYLSALPELYVEHVLAGADRAHARKLRIVCEQAAQAAEAFAGSKKVTAHTVAGSGSALPLERSAPTTRRLVLRWLRAL